MSCVLRILALVSVIGVGVASVQVEPRTLYSPIVNKPFQALVVPMLRRGAEVADASGAPDMGTDDDGCRHTSGINEYDHYVITDPYSYFSALADEWGADGRFIKDLSPDVRRWVASNDGFHDEWVTDKERLYSRAAQIARKQGRPIPLQKEWVMPQEKIPLEKRYRYALRCYKQRGATKAFQGKLALTASWALRARLNRPIVHTRLQGGIEEVNAYVQQYVEDGEQFRLDKWLEAYRKIFAKSGLTDEAYFVAGTVLVGFVLREGDLVEAKEVLEKMTKRFHDGQEYLTLRGLLRNHRRLIFGQYGYAGFLTIAVDAFTGAIVDEEFARPRLPEIMFAVAECLRRSGQEHRSIDWYLALSKMAETKPQMREELRAQDKVPSMEAPFPMLLAWRGEETMQKLEERVEHSGVISGPDTKLLNAILNEGLGTPAYEGSRWRPRTGASTTELKVMLDEVGKRVLIYQMRLNEWPRVLDDLWMHGVVRNRNALNRFCSPVSGERFRYNQLIGEQPGNTVVLATTKPVTTRQGEVYGLFLQRNVVVWSKDPVEPGQIYQPADDDDGDSP